MSGGEKGTFIVDYSDFKNSYSMLIALSAVSITLLIFIFANREWEYKRIMKTVYDIHTSFTIFTYLATATSLERLDSIKSLPFLPICILF